MRSLPEMLWISLETLGMDGSTKGSVAWRHEGCSPSSSQQLQEVSCEDCQIHLWEIYFMSVLIHL